MTLYELGDFYLVVVTLCGARACIFTVRELARCHHRAGAKPVCSPCQTTTTATTALSFKDLSPYFRTSVTWSWVFFFCTIIRIVLKNMEINRVGEHGAQRDSQPRGWEGTVPECERERESSGSRCCCEGTQNSIQNARLLWQITCKPREARQLLSLSLRCHRRWLSGWLFTDRFFLQKEWKIEHDLRFKKSSPSKSLLQDEQQLF